jgi:segregation and condensation protein B
MKPTDRSPDEVRSIVEAILVTAEEPVSPGRLLGVLKGLNGKDIRQAIDDLNERYERGGHAMTIREVAGGFQLATRKEFGPWVRKLHDRGPVRLSQAALETLAVIAFKQPVARVEVDSVRGVDSAGVVRNLMELNLIRIVGRSEGLGRPMLFGTTKEFMAHFGLKSLADLPKPRELEELLAEGQQKALERSAGLGNAELDASLSADETDELEIEADAAIEESFAADGEDPQTDGDDPQADGDEVAGSPA